MPAPGCSTRIRVSRFPGLYAAGNTMAAVSGTTYPGGGNPIGASMLFSHLAALDMAGDVRSCLTNLNGMLM